ncbi:MAG TPA: DUF6265 family protein [Bacteroidia bacterium]
MKFIVPLIALIAITSCSSPVSENTQKPAKHKVFQKLLGTWVSDYDSIKYTESWTEMSDSLLFSESCMLQGKDTLFSEKVDIQTRNNKAYYIPTVTGQNEEKPVSFEVKQFTDTSFVAENLQHDFPQRIVYSIQGDSLIAYIEGNTPKEANHREYFRMKKIK